MSSPSLTTRAARCGSLAAAGDDRFVAGPSFGVTSPAEIQLSFVRNADGTLTGVRIATEGTERLARRVSFRREEVSIQNGDIRLSGTLVLPNGPPRYPAVVRTHGAGAALRSVELAEWFAYHGVAALTYDKRGAGASSGNWMRASMHDLADDAVAAVRVLAARDDIDGTRIGLAGASQAGWVNVIAASLSTEVRFLILVQGEVLSIYENAVGESQSRLIKAGFSEERAEQAVPLLRRWRQALGEAVETASWSVVDSIASASRNELPQAPLRAPARDSWWVTWSRINGNFDPAALWELTGEAPHCLLAPSVPCCHVELSTHPLVSTRADSPILPDSDVTTTPANRPRAEQVLARVIQAYEAELLREWVAAQARIAALGGLSEVDLRRQCADFLRLLQRAAQSSVGSVEGQAWAPVREFLSDLSGERAQQGFSPSQTATFVFSLKEPLFARLRRELIGDVEALASEIWTATLLLDSLGLYTTEVFQKRREEVILRQQADMLELSTPVVALWEGILALPMIGTLDSARTQVVMETLLQRIVETGADVAIIDITGVPTVDTLTAQHLLKTVTAARLMGAECMISGIRPQIAQTIVHLGVDLGDIVTKATLADAFRLALSRSGRAVVRAAGALNGAPPSAAPAAASPVNRP